MGWAPCRRPCLTWLLMAPGHSPASILLISPQPLSEFANDSCPVLGSEPFPSSRTAPHQTSACFWGRYFTSLTSQVGASMGW